MMWPRAILVALFIQSSQGSLMFPENEDDARTIRLIFTSIGDLMLNPRTEEEVEGACTNLASIARRYGADGVAKITELKGIWPLTQVLKKSWTTDLAKKTAMVALSWLAKGHPRNADYIASYNGVFLLLHMIRTKGEEHKTWGIKALGTIAVDRPNITWEIAEQGGIATMVKVLNSGTTEEKTKALGAMSIFTRHNVSSIVVLTGGARALSAILKQGTEDQVLKAVTILGNVARSSSENAAAVAEADTIEPMTMLVARGSTSIKQAALFTLAMLGQHNAGNRERIAKAGAIKHMVDALRQGSNAQQLNAIFALTSAVTASMENQKLAVEAGVIKPLLKSAEDSSKHRVPAALALAHLAANNVDNLVAISAVGRISGHVAEAGAELALHSFGYTNLTGSLIESLAQMGGIQIEVSVPPGVHIGGVDEGEIEEGNVDEAQGKAEDEDAPVRDEL